MNAPENAEHGAQQRSRTNVNAKRNQQMLFAACCIGVCVIAVALTLVARPQVRELADFGRNEPRVSVPGEKIAAGELWRSSAEQDIIALQEGWQSLQESLNGVQESVDTVQIELNQVRAATQETAFEQEMLQLVSMEPLPTLPYQDPTTGDVVPPIEALPTIRIVRVSGDASSSALPGTGVLPGSIGIPESIKEAAAKISPQAEPSTESPLDVAKPARYLPSGSFMPAVILGGLDAPTGAVSKDNPHPVLLRIADTARLPNLKMRDLRECFVLAAGYGDISSERALLRTERLSCARADGSYLDTQLRGFVVGEDGRAGVRGKLVTKQGQILQRSLMAGIGAGLSEVVSSRQQDYIGAATSAQGQATVSVNLPGSSIGNYALAGLSGGLSNSLDRLAEYYIALAERIHPVIEVGAGRTVDIVVQEGLDLDK